MLLFWRVRVWIELDSRCLVKNGYYFKTRLLIGDSCMKSEGHIVT